jgi:hypothetical protein
VALGWLDPYIVGCYRLEVANDIFNGVGMSGLVVLPCNTRSAVWHHAIGSPYIVAVPCEWSTGLALHSSCTIAACPHILQALTAVPVYTSCRSMLALTSGGLETCARVLGIGEHCCTSRPARLFFMLEAHDPQRPAGCVVARSPPHRKAGSSAAGHAALWSPPSRSEAMVHVATPEPTLAGRWVPEPLDTWQPRSPP